MPVLDIVILVIVLLSAAIGLARGLVKEILSLAAWALSFVLAIMFSTQLAAELPTTWGAENLRLAISFVILFVGSLIVASLLQWLVAQLVRSTGLTGTDRFLGFMFGAARGVLVVIVALIALREVAQDSQWYNEAHLPPEFLAFENEVRDLLGQVREMVAPSTLDALPDLSDLPGLVE